MIRYERLYNVEYIVPKEKKYKTLLNGTLLLSIRNSISHLTYFHESWNQIYWIYDAYEINKIHTLTQNEVEQTT